MSIGVDDFLLVVIHPKWLLKIHEENDFVRVEVGTALRRGDVTVIPVLIDRAQLPSANELPDDLKPLVERQAFELSSERWQRDAEALSKAISRVTAKVGDDATSVAPREAKPREEPSGRRIVWLGAAAVVVLASALALQALRKREQLSTIAQEGCLPLYSWYNLANADSFTTTDSAWAFPSAHEGYQFRGIEGYVFDPSLPQPPNTKELVNWWSLARTDHFLTTDPEWSGPVGSRKESGDVYELTRLEGYIYSDPAPGRQPLYHHWHEGNGDNAVSTQSKVSPELGEQLAIEGYVIVPSGSSASDPVCPR